MPTARLIASGPCPPELNMALDAALAQLHSPETPPVLRVYGWSAPAISLGRHQDARDLDLDRCRRAGVRVVRRPTGGRAVYHAGEFTYSLVVSRGNGVPSGIPAAYAHLSQGLRLAFRELGCVEDGAVPVSGIPAGAACFAVPTPADLLYRGRKLVGSAQRWTGDILLQQGSILARDVAGPFFDLLAFSTLAERERAREDFRAGCVTLNDLLGRVPSAGEVIPALARGFGAILGRDFTLSQPSPDELRLADELAAGLLVVSS